MAKPNEQRSTHEPDDPDVDDADLDDELEDDPDEGDNEGEDEDDDEDGDKPLGEKGEKALARMKERDKEQRKVIRELKAALEELRNGDDEEKDELETSRDETKAERTKRVEAEKRLAAKEANLPASWAARLQGDDFEDFLEDAEAIAADLPTPQDRKGGGGAKEGQRKRKKPTLDDQISEAEASGDHRKARSLKAQKVHVLNQAV